MRPLFALCILLLAGCLHVPESVTHRRAFTSFNPAGKWNATGEFLHEPINGAGIEVFLPQGTSQFYRVVRHHGISEIEGKGLVEGDVFYVIYGPGNYVLYNVNQAGNLEGLWGSDVLGYERGSRESDFDGLEGSWKCEGVNPSGSTYDASLHISEEGDHYRLSQSSGRQEFNGAGILFAGRLVSSLVSTREVADYYRKQVTTTRTARFAVGAYKWDGQKLVGKTLVNATEDDKATASTNFREKMQPEHWSRLP